MSETNEEKNVTIGELLKGNPKIRCEVEILFDTLYERGFSVKEIGQMGLGLLRVASDTISERKK